MIRSDCILPTGDVYKNISLDGKTSKQIKIDIYTQWPSNIVFLSNISTENNAA